MFNRLICFVFVTVLFLTSAASAELVGWWKLDDGAGMVAVDSSGNGHDGTFIGDPQWVPGYINGALEFDGDDCVDTGYTEDLAIWTIACWVYSDIAPSTGQGPSGPIHREQNYQINWDHSSTTWQACAGVNVGGWHNASFQPIEAGRWYHLAATYDGEDLKAYRDGELITTNSNPSGAPAQETNSLKLARHAANDAQFFTGIVDDVKVYSDVMSEIAIRAIAYPNHKQSWKPRPEDGEVDVLLDRKIVWNQGIISSETFELYSKHNLYFGTDLDEVSSATEPTVVVTDANEYQPELDYNTTYYWRVDEVSDVDPEPIKGEVWSFTSANFIVLEDFESYTDDEPDTIYLTWIDGWGDSSNGSTSGYPDPDFIGGEHFVETDVVHGDNQAMPLFYDNTSSGLSESTKTLTELRDWTVDDVITLMLFYYGDAGNSTEPMYFAVNSSAVVYNDDPRATLNNEWTQWDIPMQKFADQGVDLTNVNSMSLGLGNKANPVPGGKGHVFFDDIRLSRSEAIVYEPEIESVNPGTANLRLYYAFENNAQDTSGSGLSATVSGNPTYIDSATGFGLAVNLDGEGDFLTLPIGTLVSSLNESSFAIWVNWSTRGGNWQRIFDFGSGEDINMFLTTETGGNMFRFAMKVSGNPAEEQTSSSKPLTSGWHHIAITIDPATSTHTLYLDGKLEGQNTSATYKPSDLGVTSQNWIGLSQYPADPYYIGSLDEFRIYNKVLTRPEVLYLAGK